MSCLPTSRPVPVLLLTVVIVAWMSMAGVAQLPDVSPVRAHQADSERDLTLAGLLAELRALREEVDQLRQSDAVKTARIDELTQKVQAFQSELVTPAVPVITAGGDSESVHLMVPAGLPQNQTDREGQEAEPQLSPLDRAIQELGQQPGGQSALDQAVQGLEPAPQPAVTAPAAAGQLQLMQISLDILTALGTSTEPEPSIQQLEGGDHDPHKRGFTLQGAELFLQGAVDPYLDAAAAISYFIDPEGETVVELEEANFTTRSLPKGLQLKAGQYFTEFGRNNPLHPHAWHWIDQPIINSRVFGPDGMRGPGARLSWLVPVEWFSELYAGVQNANGETMASYLASEEFFEERPIGGRPFVERNVRSLEDLLYYFRWENSWTDCSEETTWLLGLSGAFGPNATGPDGNTQVYGGDLTMKYKPAKNERGWPFLIWETEFTYRRYIADNFVDDVTLAGERLHDWGFYTQLLYGFKLNWAAGLRYEFAGGQGPSLDEDFNLISHNDDPFRDDRHRLAPLLAWYPTEFSRFRFQYNYDRAQHLAGKDAHSFWTSAEVLFGSHPAHRF